MIKFTTDQQLRNLARNVLPLLQAVIDGYPYNPGDSDLDNEQIIHVRMTLGDYRRAWSLLYEVEKTVIWVVMGTTGEYSDRSEWTVVAFTNKADAEKRIVACTQEANKRFTKSTVPDESNGWSSYDTKDNPLDPNMKIDYTGTSYFFYEVEIEK